MAAEKFFLPADSFTWTAVLLLTLVFIVSLFWLLHDQKKLPPGPWGLPVLGYLPWLDPKAPHISLTHLAKKYGRVYGLRMGSVYTVVLTDHKLVRQAFARDEFSGRAPLYLTHGIMQGYGLICAEGELWKDQRKFVATSLKNFGMVKFGAKRERMEKRIMVGVEQVLDKLGIPEETGKPRDILPMLLHSLGNVVNSIVFGKVWEENDKTWLWLQHLQEEGTKMIGVAGPLNFLPFLRHLPSYRNTIRFLLEGKHKTHRVYDQIVQENQGGEDVVTAFLEEMKKKEGSEFYTNAQFRHLLADLFGAGLDTTLTTLRWFLLFMATNPEVQTRIQEELDAVLEGRPPSLNDIQTLPVTEASLAETQRIRSVVPVGIPHGTLKATELGGYHIPRGAMIVPLQWSIHMDPDLWKNPDQFNPDHFLTEEGHFAKPDFFIPFQTGQRMCVGEELGRMLLYLFGASIIQRFSVSVPEDVKVDLTGECGITLTPKPHSLCFQKRF